MPRMKAKASITTVLTVFLIGALALPALAAAPIRYAGAFTGLPSGTGVKPEVSLQVVKKKGKVVEVSGGGFAGPEISCPDTNTPESPLSVLLVEPIKVKEGKFKGKQKIGTTTVTVSGRFNSTGTKATGTFLATAIGIEFVNGTQPKEVTCTSGSHPWHVSEP
jgi:hypothetical protein